jgi:hypothetical protein
LAFLAFSLDAPRTTAIARLPSLTAIAAIENPAAAVAQQRIPLTFCTMSRAMKSRTSNSMGPSLCGPWGSMCTVARLRS